MKKLPFFAWLTFFSLQVAFAQKQPLSYYLPDAAYDPKIPTPEAFLGYQIGEWHISHDQQYAYMRRLAELSPRVRLVEHGRTYENRPLIHLIITSPANHERLEAIREQHVALTDPSKSAALNLKDMPTVLYQGFSIHGNEASGANAAPLLAYYLVAGQSPEVQRLLEQTVVLFDPSFNPDGLTRFSTWANYHKNATLTGDPQDREYSEAWPGGRFNHYWFDLNRDWLLCAHPESRGRAGLFHQWKPNILTDHHEMGTQSSFFFMPGVATRVNPITPKRNQELTAKIGTYHSKFLDEIGSLYYSGEGYDDFYYGKGSTFPDANGCIGILFEQASSRGHLQETANGPLPFHFTVRNQVRTGLSTYQAAVEMRQELLEHQRTFFKDALQAGKADLRKAFVFGDAHDQARTDQLVEVLRRHQIEVYALKNPVSVEGKSFEPGNAFVVPLDQRQYTLIRGSFETMKTFEDSIFYDISSWTLPLSFNLPYAGLGKAWTAELLGEKVEGARPVRKPLRLPAQSSYAYLMEWDHYYAPKALYALLKAGIRAKVGREPFLSNGKRYEPGTVMVPVQNQEKGASEIHQLITGISEASGVAFEAAATGFTTEGIDFGSNGFTTLQLPNIAIIVGETTAPFGAGEAWHLLDTRYHIPVTKLEADDIARADLSRYNVLVFGGGQYGSVGAAGAAKLKSWVQDGGTLIGIQSAISWLKAQGIGYVEIRENKELEKPQGRRPYIQMDEDIASLETPGSIFEAEIDPTHPIGFGYRRGKLPVFRDYDLYLEPGKNPYSTPLIYTEDPLLSGYVNAKVIGQAKRSAGVVVSGAGSGKVIFMADDPNFRAHWFGTNKLFANAVFFGHTISGSSIERAPSK